MSAEKPTPHATPTGAAHQTAAVPGGFIGHLLHMIPPQYLAGGFALALVAAAMWEMDHKRNKGSRKLAKQVTKKVNKKLGKQQDEAAAKVIGGIVGFFWRFFTGREMNGTAASNARFLSAGRRPLSVVLRNLPPSSELGTVAIPDSAIVVPGPGAAVERWRAWTATHPLPEALDGPVRRAGVGAVWLGGAVSAGARGAAAGLSATGRILRAWGTWPYACRALVRLAVIGAGLGLWLHRTATIYALAALVLALVVASATGPAGLRLWHGVTRGDDQVYGPALWAAARLVLGQNEEEYMDNWLYLAPDLTKDGAEIRMALPVPFAGNDTDRQQLDHLVNTRVPGEWVSRFHMMRGQHYAVWTRKPKPKPKPECPDRVGFFDSDIQAAIRACRKGEIVIGKDENNRIIIKKLDGETPHWALSVGSGGGKSAFTMMVMAQVIGQGYHVIVVDVKRVSVDAFQGVPGVYIYNDPMNPQDMRNGIEWFKDELDARSAVKEIDKAREFPGLFCVLEESNEFADVSKDWWAENRPKDAPASDPVWGDVASSARLGRHVHGNILGIFQDLRDQALGGKGVRNLFRLKFMGNFSVNSWKNVVGTTPVPESYEKAGRMMIVEGSNPFWVQTLYGEPEDLRAWAMERRQATRFDPAAGLYGTPPAPSPKRLPKLLQALSRDELPEALRSPLEGGPAHVAPGGGVTPGRRDATRHGLVPPQRDGLGEVPSEPTEADVREIVGIYRDALGRTRVAGLDGVAASWRTDATEPADAAPADDVVDAESEELLSLAEISRRLEEKGIKIPDGRMRQHKKRDREQGKNLFPQGTTDGKNTLYTMREIVGFYAEEIKEQWRNRSEESR